MPNQSTMNKVTLEALLASIRHWEQITQAESIHDISMGRSSCALCGVFNNYYHLDNEVCVGCPVFERSGLRYCKNTPYIMCTLGYALWKDVRANGYEDSCEQETFREYACRELEFLRSLVPQEHLTQSDQTLSDDPTLSNDPT